MATSRTHITALPRGFIIVRILQFLCTLITLVLSIVVTTYSIDYPMRITIVPAAVTLLVFAWIVIATYLVPKAYNYWAILAMEVIFFLVWVVGFTWALISAFYGYTYFDDVDCKATHDQTINHYEKVCHGYTSTHIMAGNALIAISAFAASNMILWLVSMIVVSVFISRHRKAGGSNKIGSQMPNFGKKNNTVGLDGLVDYELKEQNWGSQQEIPGLDQQNPEAQRLALPPAAAQLSGNGYGRDIVYGNSSERIGKSQISGTQSEVTVNRDEITQASFRH